MLTAVVSKVKKKLKLGLSTSDCVFATVTTVGSTYHDCDDYLYTISA